MKFYFAVEFDYLVQLNQSPELGVCVADIEVAAVVPDLRVHPGNRDVLEPNLALVASSDANHVVVVGTDDVEAAFLPTFLAIVDALQDKVGLLRFVYRDHLHVEIVSPLHQAGEGLLADFALKLGKVVGDDHTGHFFLHLAVNPHLEALNVHSLARTLALAGTYQEVVIAAVVAQAELAGALVGHKRSLIDAVELSQKQVLFFCVLLGDSSDLHHSILNSAELDDISRT